MFLPEVSEVLFSVSVELIKYWTCGLVVFFVALAIGAIASSGQ